MNIFPQETVNTWNILGLQLPSLFRSTFTSYIQTYIDNIAKISMTYHLNMWVKVSIECFTGLDILVEFYWRKFCFRIFSKLKHMGIPQISWTNLSIRMLHPLFVIFVIRLYFFFFFFFFPQKVAQKTCVPISVSYLEERVFFEDSPLVWCVNAFIQFVLCKLPILDL